MSTPRFADLEPMFVCATPNGWSKVGETQAQALVQVSENQYATPAREKTAQARQESVRYVAACAVVVIVALLIVNKPEAGWPLAALVAVLGGVEALRRRKPPQA